MKVLISGSSGTGKTTLMHELARRGYAAYDSDEVGLAKLIDTHTGQVVPWPKGFVDFSRYSWDWQADPLKKLLESNNLVILGGINGNQADFYNLFDKCFVLTLPPDEHLRRMRTRPLREAGDDEKNIQSRLTKYPILMERFLAAGFVPIDASGSVSDTADTVLEQLR